tara:strand:+ start:262 stop:693 length:432 start_codon:yes stop_codon:yes gene_type:complete
MKFLASLLLIGATSAPVLAGPATGYKSSGGFAREEKCFKAEYREEYVPGTAKNPGYVKSYKKKVRVPCQPKVRYVPAPEPHIHSDPHPNVGKVDDNSCIEGSILGGIAGGGLGAALSRKEGRLWAIPTGIVGGALVGCQMDGG